MKSQFTVLAIETSCDETSAAIVCQNESGVHVRSNIVSSQIQLHAKWGGVVPSLAAREHVVNIIPVIKQAFLEAHILPEHVDCIAVTNRPGLIPALLIGTMTAKTLSWLWKKPLIGIHHIEGHIYANSIENDKEETLSNIPHTKNEHRKKEFNFPILALVVSGGHTQIVLMRNHVTYEIIGETQDDAAGEAFDKVARLLGLEYPGGPAVSREAKKYREQTPQIQRGIVLPRPMIQSKNYHFSFSGLKTAVLTVVKKTPPDVLPQIIPEICHEFQQAVIDVLTEKTLRAAQEFSPKTILLAGGVSANIELRAQLEKKVHEEFSDVTYLVPSLEYSVDNAVMIGAAACFRWKIMSAKEREQAKKSWKSLEISAHERMRT